MGLYRKTYNYIKYKFLKKALIKCSSYNFYIHSTSSIGTYNKSSIEINGIINIQRYVLIDIYTNSRLVINNNSYIGDYSIIRGDRCTIHIGSNTIIGQGVKIYSTNHKFNKKDILIRDQDIDLEKNDIYIGNDCWIGGGAIIVPGVKLGNGVVVGAGSIVTKSFPDYSVVAGNPAKLIKYRE